MIQRNKQMRYIFPFIWMLLLAGYHQLPAQVTPPGPYSTGTTMNYMRTFAATAPDQDPTHLVGRGISDVKQSTQYADGLGRPLQTVAKGMSPNGYDMVSPVVYDNMGREAYRYLPYTSSGITGEFKTDPFNEQQTFMQQFYSSEGEHFFYGQVQYDNSPMSRVTKVMAAGNSWSGSNRGVETGYGFNTTNEVVLWNVDDDDNNPPVSPGYYPAGTVYRTVATDENGKMVVEYKDNQGRVVLKKVQLTGTDITSHTGWLCTYYLYDELNNLRFVMPPKATELIAGNGWSFTNSANIITDLCFTYTYDHRGRAIAKQVPGGGVVEMVYDVLDRLVMTRDANLTGNGQWKVVQYDALNRITNTYLWNNTTDRATHAANAASTASYPSLTGTYQLLTQTFYDNYNWVSGTGLSSSFNSGEASTANGFSTDYNTTPYPVAITPTSNTTGMLTGTKVNIIGTNNYLYTASFYDDKGRTIQTASTNITGGIDINTTQYTFDGRVLNTRQNQNVTGYNPGNTTAFIQNAYDDRGRLIQVQHQTNGGDLVPNATNIYDELGQLQEKQVGDQKHMDAQQVSYIGPAEVLDYTYNIRGWLDGINKDDVIWQPYPTGQYFSLQLQYDNGAANNQYNGNIARASWKTFGGNASRAYDYSYDATNRLMKADFTQLDRNSNSWGPSASVNYNVVMGDNGTNPTNAYDANGNILRMQQYGIKGVTSSPIDDLSYTYFANSNKLASVTDAYTVASTTLGDFNDGSNTGDDYAYDNNGNLIIDNNKKISSINYNYLNRPSSINFSAPANSSIVYTYDAAGNKLQKTVTENGSTTTDTYIDGFVYEQVSTTGPIQLLYFGQPEGRVRPAYDVSNSVTGFNYDYFIKDHLGNTRVVLTDELANHIYPPATLESGDVTDNQSAAYIENQFYTIDPSKIVGVADVPAFDPNWDYNDNDGIPNPNPNGRPGAQSQFMYKLNGSSNSSDADKTGLGILVKVMAGDLYTIAGSTYYHDSHTTDNDVQYTQLLTDLLATPSSTAILGNHASDIITGAGDNIQQASFDFFQNWNGAYNTSFPRASINWILFDNQFKYVSAGLSQVGSADEFMQHMNDLTNIQATANGYLYVYCSNESDVDVFFDNLQVVHTPGPLLEETHYYPFGLTMAGISSKAAGSLENKYKFNGGSELQHEEFSDGSGLELYATEYRSLDPQIGRWWQIDPMPNEMESPYSAMQNNPIKYNDVLGDTTTFYGAQGNFFFGVNDKGPNKAVVIDAKKEDAFINSYYENFALVPSDKRDLTAMSNTLSSFGTGYDIGSFEKFYDENGKSVPAKYVDGNSVGNISDFKENGKSARPYAEVMGNLVIKDGTVTVGKGKSSSGIYESSFFSDLPDEANKVGDIHTHPLPVGEGFSYSQGHGILGSTTFGSSSSGPSPADYSHAVDNKGGVRNVVVDSKNVYLINGNSKQTIQIKRN